MQKVKKKKLSLAVKSEHKIIWHKKLFVYLMNAIEFMFLIFFELKL